MTHRQTDMETGALGVDTSVAPDPRVTSGCSKASMRRLAWAQSRDSQWQESKQESCSFQGPHRDEDRQRPSDEPGRIPNKITSWLSECRTPLGASLDDQSASPSKGALKNGCSFEDDLSLGAEANHLHSTNNKTEPCFSLAADQKRSQFKEKGRSMNSTGSGKSSTVSSVSGVLEQAETYPVKILLTLRVSELLDLYEEDPEEILLNLGFGREEPDLASKIPSRFFNSSSSARGIDMKVYLGAQLQRMELENPNYALTSRFRQIEVLTTVANEFFQLYSQVSGQPVQCISSSDQQGGERGGNESSPPLKRSSSALNVAKFIKRTFSNRNLLTPTNAESSEAHTSNQHKQLNGHTPSEHTHTNGDVHAGPEQDNPDLQAEMVSQKHVRKRDSSLATVTEETNGDSDTDRLRDDSPKQSSTEPATNGECQPESADLQSPNRKTEEIPQVVKREDKENLISTTEKVPLTLTLPQLAQLRNENADSFDIEEIQSNEDDALPPRDRATDLLRTVSQQSDSSGFAEEPSADSSSSLKVQESSDSCDSETTVTSHVSRDVTTPLAMDQPAFIFPEGREEEVALRGAAEADRKNSSNDEDEIDGISEQVPLYSAHQLPKNRPVEAEQDENQGEEQIENGVGTDSEPEAELEVNHTMSASEQPPQQNKTEITSVTEGVGVEDETHEFFDDSSSFSSVASSVVLCALNRAKQHQLSRAGINSLPSEMPQISGRGQGGRGIRMERSSSLPSSLLSPSRVVSSVRIQFGRGQSSCTQPRYSFRYTQENKGDKEEEVKEHREQEEEGQTSCRSTLLINPASSSGSTNQPTRLPTEGLIPPKPIPRYLMESSSSLQGSSPPPDWSGGGCSHYWSTQSVPDLSFTQQQPGYFQQNMSTNQNKQTWSPGHMTYSTPSPHYLYPSPNSSPSVNPSPYPFCRNTPPQYPSPLNPYASLPNLYHHHKTLNHHSSLTSLHQALSPTFPKQGSFSSLHHPSASIPPHHSSLGNMDPVTSIMHQQSYNHSYSNQLPYHPSPHGSQIGSPYLGYHGYNTNPHVMYPHPITQCPPLAPEHSLHPGLATPAPGFHPGLASTLPLGHNLHPELTPPLVPAPGLNQGPSTTEMQLRRVLHDIRGTVQSLSQNRADTPDAFIDHRAALSSHQSLAEFQQKRRSLNLFRGQMMDLELAIIRQQALVYKHLSPADRLEVEQLQALRSAVREELQELEQQLEDRLMEMTHHMGLHRDGSVDSLSANSALRAMEPVSDLLREQLFLQSELSYDGQGPSTNPSSRSSSPVTEGGDGEQRQNKYRASINITPFLPPRPNTCTEEEEEGERDKGGGGEGSHGEVPEEDGAQGVRVENLQQLIREIRESVAQEVRQEIYSELLAAVSPRQSPLPTRQHPL